MVDTRANRARVAALTSVVPVVELVVWDRGRGRERERSRITPAKGAAPTLESTW